MLLSFCFFIYHEYISKIRRNEMPDKPDEKSVNKLKELLGLDYEDFVKKLGKDADDPKLLAAIQAGKKDGKLNDERVSFVSKTIPVKKLHPTQNEIDVSKSLKYSLVDVNTNSLDEILVGKNVLIKSHIITLNGKYIIDGHHRWSRTYCMNPDAEMEAYDMQVDEDPIEVLKAVQLAIAVKLKDVPTAEVEGRNLLKIGEEDLKKYVVKHISKETIKILKEHCKIKDDDKNEAADYIWGNVEQMQETSKPIKDAPDRDVMPQTSHAKDDEGSWRDVLKAGVINFKEPVVRESSRTMRHIMLFENFSNKDAKYNEWKAGLKGSKFQEAQDGKTVLAYNKDFDITGKWHKDKNTGETFDKPTEKYDSYF